jgi:hypothetical protein
MFVIRQMYLLLSDCSLIRFHRNDACCHTCYTGLWRDAMRAVKRLAGDATSSAIASVSTGDVQTMTSALLRMFEAGRLCMFRVVVWV